MSIKKRPGGFGITVGTAFTVAFLFLHMFVDRINYGFGLVDDILWIFQVVMYFFASLTASNIQFRAQQTEDNTLLGVADAGRGAAMILSVSMWIYLIVRSILLNDSGMFGGAGIIPFIFYIMLDFAAAIALGSWGGAIVVKRNNYHDGEDRYE